MPDYRCVNIGTEGYPAWLTLSEKSTIVAIEPATYPETGLYSRAFTPLLTTVTLVVAGCCVEVKSPLPVEGVCRILGFMWDDADVTAEAQQPEPEKTEGGGPQ